MKRLFALLIVLLCSASSAPPSVFDFALIQATDLHYLDKALYDEGPLFTSIEQNGDGKFISKGDQLLDRLIAYSAVPGKALLLTGDLTFNGEKASHLALVKRLHALEALGTPVYVLPGNHDIRPHAWKLTGAKEEQIESIDAAGFKELYASFGYDEAFSRDAHSFSYATYLSKDTVLVALDVNTKASPYRVDDQTMLWLEQLLSMLQEKKLKYITVSHQNLFVHNKRFTLGYQFEQAGKLIEMFSSYPPIVHLSGHLHIQHQTEQNGVIEIATSSMAIHPHHVAVITASGYEALPLMEEDFLKVSLDFYLQTAINRVISRLADTAISAPEQRLMAEVTADANAFYFSGRLDKLPVLEDHPGMKLWQKYRASFFSTYLLELFNEVPYDHTKKDFYENTDSDRHR